MITFKNDNDVIVYALEKIIEYARKNQYIFVAQCVWWLASIIGLESGLVTHINSLRVRAEVYEAPSVTCSNPGVIHPDRLFQVQDSISNQEEKKNQELSELESEPEITSEDNLHNSILDNSEEFLRQSAFKRKMVARRNLQISRKLIKELHRIEKHKQKPRKNWKDQTEGIEASELKRRNQADECECCAWPKDRKGGHNTTDCFRWKRLEKGTVPLPKRKN